MPEKVTTEAPEVQTIRIDVDGRYLLVITAPTTIPVDELSKVQGVLNRWWASKEKFLVLGIRPEASIRLERVDAPE